MTEEEYIDPYRLDPMQEFLGNGRNESILRDWAKRLKYFRLTVPTSRRVIHGDQLVCRIHYQDDADMLNVTHALGLAPYCFASYEPEWLRHSLTVSDTSMIRYKLGEVQYYFLGGQLLQIRISGNAGNIYVVTEEDVRVAEMLEAKIAPFASQVIDPPLDYEHCFCPKYYPEFFR
jgi:hypothetical protein